jgi:2-polyprenyl-3-methyl-5-hydroxy-6-metoxy-1,4-benzoquinol methylase
VEEPSTSANDVTLRTYQESADQWMNDSRRSGSWFEVVSLIDDMVASLRAHARVLEIGSASGEEAKVMESRGLDVRRSDATPAFVDALRRAGHQVDQLNVITDALGGPWDAIFANAVFLHLERFDFARVLEKSFDATTGDGLLVFTLKEGVGAEWVTKKLNGPRHFTYWSEPDLVAAIDDSPWTLRSMRHVDGDVDQWLFCICAKA